MAGVLYLVGTPIGNLEDMTYRAVRTLREADVIACEDTRRTRGLLSHFAIAGKKLLSCHEHNEDARAAELVKRVEAGERVALVSDAGMPAVSDPGYRVVRAMVEAGLRVEPIPGPSAAIAAVAVSGLPTDAFRFCSFLPAKASQRRRMLEALAGETATLVFYEAPHRIRPALADLEALFGDRPIVIARELTKLHEEILRGTPASLGRLVDERGGLKGELVLLVSGARQAQPDAETPLEERVNELTAAGASRMDAIKQAARERGIGKREAYEQLERLK
ncbi:MAG: 16S rRNA (cytidine(1402)-2'-O)-methyltransferase [Bryobacterales bacterium]|nr:16S rRNA (cytidine(1402)-2'-O)-methyltransferase [Acidobacteriota bacterium]MCB9384072.1 16S rRNA (cytidine(1402)-2'-O)-methyltransferase [Bryobacterales bacterium]